MLNTYDVYLRNEKEKETFHFPVNPIGEITLNRSKKYDTADIVDFGEVDLSDKGKKIKEVSFSTLLPKEYDTYCRYIN
ncbi:phage portal protein, partial [Clostridiaceae bacterium UIB06]|nr:phage portal protein [Clostridiaceae bacterium UIB06]